MGHIRDLPSKGLNVDTENGFKVDYEVHVNKKDVIKELKAALKDADELYLATDEDREGEAISWHLHEVLKPKVPVKRMVFHEITRSAIERAVDVARDIDYGLVDAQESRRIVDRLFGYPVTPPPAPGGPVAAPGDIASALAAAQEGGRIVAGLFAPPAGGVCGRKTNPRLSAGRVQSPAVRLVVERERERMAFVAADYWG